MLEYLYTKTSQALTSLGPTGLLLTACSFFYFFKVSPAKKSNMNKLTSKQALTTLNRQLNLFNKLVPQGFGSILGLSSSGGVMDVLEFKDNRTLITRLSVPDHLCVSSKSQSKAEAKTLPLSAMLAMFDEVTTWTIFILDPFKRSGVSILLSAECITPHIPIKPNTQIIIKSKASKMGKTFAFMEIEAFEEQTGRLLVTGRHTKYLPMGFAYDIAFKYFFGLSEYVANTFGKFGESNEKIEALKRPVTEVCNISDVEVGFDDSLPSESALVAKGAFKVTTPATNPMGTLHGGCSAILSHLFAEEIVMKSVKENMNLKSMNMTYATTGKGEVNIEGKTIGDVSDLKLGGMSTRVQIRRKGGNDLVSEGCFYFEKREGD